MDAKLKEEKLRMLTDRIESQLRKAIATDPNPIYTNLSDCCYFCNTWTTTLRLTIVEDPSGLYDDGAPACEKCIERRNLRPLDNMKALEYEARTRAVVRIRKGTGTILSIERRC